MRNNDPRTWFRRYFYDKRPHRANRILTLILACSVAAPATLAGPAERSEESLIVTGTFIRGTPQDSPSPVQTLSRETLVTSGVTDIGEAIRNLSIASGSDTAPSDGTRFNGATGGGLANVNLRGLGPSSTLVVLDGKRLPEAGQKLSDGDRFVDINSIPLTMIERVEVLKDGGSALYGSDAIAGVVNFITRDTFEGAELRYNYQKTTEGAQDDGTFGGIWGIASEDGNSHLVLGGEYLQRGQLKSKHKRDLVSEQYAKQDASIVSSSTVRGDPLCASQGFFLNNDNNSAPNVCFRNGSDTGRLVPKQRRRSAMLIGSHSFNEAAEVYTQASWMKTESGTNIPLFVGPIEPKFFFPSLIGSLAGLAHNPFTGGAPGDPSVIANGGPLPAGPIPGVALPLDLVDFTLRIPGQGPQRSGEVFSNKSITTRYQLGLRGDFDLGTKPWRYDISATRGDSEFSNRLVGIDKNRLELALYGLGGPSCTPNGTISRTNPTAAFGRSLLAGADGVFDPNANSANPANQGALEPLMLAVMGTVPNFAFINPDNLLLAMTSSNIGTGGCQFFNPYLTRNTNPALANSDALLRWMEVDMRDFQKSQTFLSDYGVVAAGEMFNLWDQPVSIAIGAQYREEGRDTRVHPQLVGSMNSFGQLVGAETVAGLSENRNFDADRDVYAGFVELRIPFGEKVDVQLAGRFEDYRGDIGSTFDPKLAIRWQALDSLVLRGSASSSFRAPAISQIEEGTGFSLEFGVRDVLGMLTNPAGANCVRTGRCAVPANNAAPNLIIVKRGAASPNLQPEEATTFNVGAIYSPIEGPLEGLTVGFDYYMIEFKDKIIDVPTQAFLTEELALFNAARAANNYVIVQPSAADLGAACNPADAVFNVGAARAEECQVNPAAYAVNEGNSSFSGNITRRQDLTRSLQIVAGNAINTGRVETSGVDVNLRYVFDVADIGTFIVAGDLNWIDEFLVKDFPVGQPDFDAAGHTNRDPEKRLARSMPDLKGNVGLSWVRDKHAANLTMRFVGGYEDNAPPALRLQSRLGPYYAFDARYTYIAQIMDNDLELTVGAIDLFDATLPNVRDGFGTDITVFDQRGRRVYAGLTYRL